MKVLPFLIIGAAAILFMGLAGQTHKRLQPKINRERHDAEERAENVERGYNAQAYQAMVEDLSK